MIAAPDLDAYFARIEWGGATSVGYETLAGILLAHTARIPFENLDVLLGKRVRLDVEALTAKLVHARRGGYCFEQATLLAAVLERLGFAPVRHTARVTIANPRDVSPRTHMILSVTLPEGTFIADPGFGAQSPRLPVPLVDGREVRVGNDVHWMAREDRWWVLRTRAGDKVTDCWATTLDADNLIDFELGNHYTSTHPDSVFVNHAMMCAHATPERITIIDRNATVHQASGPVVRALADRRELRALVAERFGFDLPEVERMRVPGVPEWA